MKLSVLKWDSNFFGFTMAEVPPPSLATSRRAFQMGLAESGAQWVQCCVPHNGQEGPIIAVLESLGFQFVDTRVELRGPVDSSFTPSPRLNVRTAYKADVEKLDIICNGIFTPESRFSFRSIIPFQLVDKFYRTWIDNSHAGTFDDACFVAEVDNTILGFVTVREMGNGILRMGLMGIHPQAQKHGVGSTLTHFCKNYAKEKGCHTIEAITEGKNVATQNFHKKNGLSDYQTKSWYYYLTPEIVCNPPQL